MFGISPMQLLIILVIVVLLFGTKKLRGLGGDLGSAMKAMSDDDKDKDADFVAKEKVEDKSADDAENTVQQSKSEQKEKS